MRRAEAELQRQIDSAEWLSPAHPVRLGYELDKAVRLHEIEGSTERAHAAALKAHDELTQPPRRPRAASELSLAELHRLEPVSYEAGALLARQLREAIGEWSTELAPPRACENATSRRHEVTTADVTDE